MLLIFILVALPGILSIKPGVVVEKGNPGNVQVPIMIYASLGEPGIIALPQVKNYRRAITNEDDQINDEQVFSICNKKNKNSCGFWRSVQTKKMVPTGATHYDSKLKALVVQNMTKNDLGVYMTGNRKKYTFVMQKLASG